MTAKADLDAAAAIDPHNFVVFHGRGLIAERADRMQDAVNQFSAALASKPDSYFAIWHRARAYRALGRNDQALADADAYIAHDPADVQMHLLRANILKERGDNAGAAHEADALVATEPKTSYPLVVAGRIYAAAGRQDDAMRSLGAALGIKPEAYIYVNRYNIRPKTDIAGRQADLEAALRLDPSNDDALTSKAYLQGEQGDWNGSVATLTPALLRKPNDPYLLMERTIAYAKLGNKALAVKDFDTARAGLTTAGDHNNLCYDVAKSGMLLAEALDECEKAVAMAPNIASIRDSRAFVLLRLGRIDEALADYDKVLAAAPAEVSSLYGRSLAEARKGDKVAADRDAAAAVKLDPEVVERFKGYGLSDATPPEMATSMKTSM